MAAARSAAAAGSARRTAGRRSPRDQWYPVHAPLGGALARLPARIRALYDHLQPLQPLEPSGHLAGHVPSRDRPRRAVRDSRDRQLPCQGAPLGSGRKRGAFEEAIGRSRGGRTTAIHVLTDALGRPRLLRLAPGNMHDVMIAPVLLSATGPITRLI